MQPFSSSGESSFAPREKLGYTLCVRKRRNMGGFSSFVCGFDGHTQTNFILADDSNVRAFALLALHVKQRREPLVRLGYCLLNDNAILHPSRHSFLPKGLGRCNKLMASLAHLYFIVHLFSFCFSISPHFPYYLRAFIVFYFSFFIWIRFLVPHLQKGRFSQSPSHTLRSFTCFFFLNFIYWGVEHVDECTHSRPAAMQMCILIFNKLMKKYSSRDWC